MGLDISFRSLPNRPACSVFKSSTASSPPRADESRAELLLCRPSPVASPSSSFRGCLPNLILHLHRAAAGPAVLYPDRNRPSAGR